MYIHINGIPRFVTVTSPGKHNFSVQAGMPSGVQKQLLQPSNHDLPGSQYWCLLSAQEQWGITTRKQVTCKA